MSWHFSRALVEEFLRASCSDGEPFAQWKSIPTAPDDLCSDRLKGTFHHSPFGTMYAPSTDSPGAALLTWFLEDSPARTFPQQERRPESKETLAGFGPKWPESFVKFDPDTHSWRTHQCSLIEGLETFSETWPQWGLMRNGECLDLTTLAPITSGKGRGLWPTPCHGSSRWGGTFQEVGGSKNKLRNTPVGKLYVNPDFWESLMAWPTGWTGTAPLETDKTQEWQRQLSPRFPNSKHKEQA
jgi:hypothetical protein